MPESAQKKRHLIIYGPWGKSNHLLSEDKCVCFTVCEHGCLSVQTVTCVLGVSLCLDAVVVATTLYATYTSKCQCTIKTAESEGQVTCGSKLCPHITRRIEAAISRVSMMGVCLGVRQSRCSYTTQTS